MIEKALIQKTLSLWGINNTKTELIAYRENFTFKAQDDFGNRLVLRFHRKNYSHKYEIVSELLWLEALNEKGINVPLFFLNDLNFFFIFKSNNYLSFIYITVNYWPFQIFGIFFKPIRKKSFC